MGGCTSQAALTREDVWTAYFVTSHREAMKAQDATLERVAAGELDATSLEDLGRHGKRLQNEFSEKHQTMIKRIFEFYDEQKIGYLTVNELETLCVDCLEMALEVAPKQLPIFFEKFNKASAKMMQKLNDTGHVLTSEELGEAQTRLQERLHDVQQSALETLRTRVELAKQSYRDLALSLLPRLKAPLNRNKGSNGSPAVGSGTTSGSGTTGNSPLGPLGGRAMSHNNNSSFSKDDVASQFALSGDFVTQSEFLSQFVIAAAEVLDPYYDVLLNDLRPPVSE